MAGNVSTLRKPQNPVTSLMSTLESFEAEKRDMFEIVRPFLGLHPSAMGELQKLDIVTLRQRYELAYADAFAPTNRDHVLAAMAMMLNVLPPPKGDAKMFLDMLVSLLLAEPSKDWHDGKEVDRVGFSPVVLAAIVRKVVATLKFAPTIAEILDIAREERRRVQGGGLGAVESTLRRHAYYVAHKGRAAKSSNDS